MPSNEEKLPSTLEKSPAKVQRTYEKTLDNAHEECHDEARAHRTAWSAVKKVAEKKPTIGNPSQTTKPPGNWVYFRA